MQRVAKKHEASLQFDHGDVIGRVRPRHPDLPVDLERGTEDGSNFMMAMLDLPKRDAA